MYRVYDKKEKCWVKDDIYLAPNNDLFMLKKTKLGTKKLSLVSDKRYIVHKYIELSDMKNVLIYEGDIVEVQINKDSKINMLVTYSPDISSYIILDFNENKYYSLGINNRKFVKVIGNIFENRDLLPAEAYEDERSELND